MFFCRWRIPSFLSEDILGEHWTLDTDREATNTYDRDRSPSIAQEVERIFSKIDEVIFEWVLGELNTGPSLTAIHVQRLNSWAIHVAESPSHSKTLSYFTPSTRLHHYRKYVLSSKVPMSHIIRKPYISRSFWYRWDVPNPRLDVGKQPHVQRHFKYLNTGRQLEQNPPSLPVGCPESIPVVSDGQWRSLTAVQLEDGAPRNADWRP